jgi:hypothetical protein
VPRILPVYAADHNFHGNFVCRKFKNARFGELPRSRDRGVRSRQTERERKERETDQNRFLLEFHTIQSRPNIIRCLFWRDAAPSWSSLTVRPVPIPYHSFARSVNEEFFPYEKTPESFLVQA